MALAKNTIFNDLSEPMCCGCGVCAAVCPPDAIDIKVIDKGINFPQFNEEKCIYCGKCRKVCPGINTNFDDLNQSVFGNLPDDYRIGNFISIYKGYAQNQDLRYKCSSGGMITEILLSLFRKKAISKAMVTRLNYGDAIRSEAFIASTEQEIIESRGSKYCPVSLDKALKKVVDTEGKTAVVCLPCHAIAIRKAMSCDERLKQSIRYIFTLFCNQTPSYKALRHFLRKQGIKEKNVKHFQWRGGGWPGATKVVTNDNEERSFFFPDVWASVFGSGHFTPYACYCCYDFFGEFSDVSFGDAWLPETANDKIGTNVVISRTPAGDDALKLMSASGEIHLERLEKDRLLKAFSENIKSKKTGYALHKKLIPKCPDFAYSHADERPNIKDNITEIKKFLKIKFGGRFFL